ncbi:MAG: PilX N-terminal domain-containing pilus assembly protein [Sideroxydans sp.]|nr:PilX N-terminal domain-containing pilus assembly protein [Sideroxydans sp.]
MRVTPPPNIQKLQHGSTLVVSLIILVILMLLGVTAMVTSDTQSKLAGNLQFENAAMNNAETSAGTAETWLATGTNFRHASLLADPCDNRSSPELYPLNTTVNPPTPCLASNTALTMVWNDNNSTTVADETQRYMIELMSVNSRLQGSSQGTGGRSSSGCNQVNTYRITARGESRRGATKFVQSYFSVLSC